MFSTLDVDIRPGRGLGRFEIGSSLWTVLDLLRQLQHLFPQVDIKYDPDTSATTPIILHLRPHLDLLFSGTHQRLHTICLRRLRDSNPPVTLRYQDIILSSNVEILRRVSVSRAFGPTYPGDELRYPGVWFSFEEDGIGDGLKSTDRLDRLQEVKRVFITQKADDGQDLDALDEVLECPVMDGEIKHAVIKIHDGIVLHFYPTSSKPLHLRLGETTAQDLMIDLGPPPRTHYKEDERMTIHSTEKDVDGSQDTDYFYNYFQHGLDFLISGSDHILKKVIVHTNVPGTPLFQRYKRCNWEIEGKPEDDEDDTPPRKKFYDRFETISHFLSPHEPPPSMLLDRTDEEEDLALPNATTRLFGYDGVVLEVSASSQVVSVTLF